MGLRFSPILLAHCRNSGSSARSSGTGAYCHSYARSGRRYPGETSFQRKNVFRKSFQRANLAYVVRITENKNEQLLKILKSVPGTSIVYVRNRKKTKEVADFLNQNGITAEYFHAGLKNETRDERQNRWKSGETRVIVSTNAFGMGIDKAEVRSVIHLDLPDSLEAYFQEAGRAGRDEKKSFCRDALQQWRRSKNAKTCFRFFPRQRNGAESVRFFV